MRCSIGLREPSEILILASLYQRLSESTDDIKSSMHVVNQSRGLNKSRIGFVR